MNEYPDIEAVPSSDILEMIDAQHWIVKDQRIIEVAGWVSDPWYLTTPFAHDPSTIYQLYLERVQRFPMFRIVREADGYMWDCYWNSPGSSIKPVRPITAGTPSGSPQLPQVELRYGLSTLPPAVRGIPPPGTPWQATSLILHDYRYTADYPGYKPDVSDYLPVKILPSDHHFDQMTQTTRSGQMETAQVLYYTCESIDLAGYWGSIELGLNPYGSGSVWAWSTGWTTMSRWQIYTYQRRVQYAYLCSRSAVEATENFITPLLGVLLAGGLTLVKSLDGG